jgi:DME family drug/metabolite transporter
MAVPAGSGAATPRRAWLGVVALVGCAALWSLNGPLIKLLDAADVSAITIASYRSLIGGAVFLPLALPRWRGLFAGGVAWPVASVLVFTIMTASFVLATTMTAAANAIILQYTSPIWVFLLAPLLLGERPARAEAAILLVAMAGVGVIFAGNPQPDSRGLIIALVSGFGYGTLTVTLRALRNVNPTVVAGWNALGSGLILAVWIAADESASFALTPRQWALMLLLALVQFTTPYVLFSWALQYVEAHQAALILLLETVLNPIWTFLLVGEVPPPATLAGGPLILLGVAGWMVLAWRRERRQRTAATIVPAP